MLAVSTVASGAALATPGLASAQPPATVSEAPPSACKGTNELHYIDLQAFYVKLNSCSAKEFADNLGNGKDVAGISGGLASKSWEAGALAAALSGALWYNQSAVEDCVAAAPGQGISFAVAAGFVVRCKPQ
jgi:hypothetical protein